MFSYTIINYYTYKINKWYFSWEDGDGDEVTIASDEELVIALTEMTGPVYKITINIKGEKKEEPAEKEEGPGEVHPGVSCDGCDGPVVGAR